MDANIRTIKDYLKLYNSMSSFCFNNCVDNFNSRNLDANEIECVENCADKFIRLNHRFMKMYIVNDQKRRKDAETAALAESNNLDAIPNNSNEPLVNGTEIESLPTPQLSPS